jgi:rare lipoprotein A
MIIFKKSALGMVTRSRTALAVFAATVAFGGGVSEASARGYHHHHHHHHHHVWHHFHRHHASAGVEIATAGPISGSWRDANASFAPVSHSGRSFSGIASYYGNESGNRTASGQRMNANAMTCAHRSLPFGTRLRVTHGGRSVVVTVNDRGPFVRGRVLDLSTGAARAIGLTSAGVGRVTAEVVS